MPGVLTKLPDSTRITRIAESTRTSCSASVQAHADLGSGGVALAPAAGVFGTVTGGATVDLAGLGQSLGAALDTIGAALPSGVLEQVEGIDRSYRKVVDLVGGNPLLGLLPDGSALSDVVRQVIAEALVLFERRVSEAAEHLLGEDEVAALLEGFALIEGLRTDYPAHAAQLPDFMASTLLGFDPQVLGRLRVHFEVVVGLLGTLAPEKVSALIGRVRASATAALNGAATAVDALDPAVAAGYQRLTDALDEASGTVAAAGEALLPLYQDVAGMVPGMDPERLLDGYLTLLDSVELTERDLVDDVLDSTLGLLDDLVATVQQAASPDEIAAGVRQLGARVSAGIAGSGIGQAREQIVDFLGGIAESIASIPLAQAREALKGMLERVGTEIADLGLADLALEIEGQFDALAGAAGTAASEAANQVAGALGSLLDDIDALPADNLLQGLEDAVAQLGDVVHELRDGAAGLVDDLQAQLDGLTGLSFTPLADDVIGEINELRDRLRAMNPDALSEESKLAVRAALAVLEALDVEGTVVDALGTAYRELDAAVRVVLEDIAAGLDRVRRSLGELNPENLLAPVTQQLSKVRATVDSLDAAALTTGLRVELERLDSWLSTLKPGGVLAPLQDTYGAGLAAVHRLDPDAWGAPLVDLHAQLAALTDRLDLSPVFAELNERRSNLVDLVRDSLASAVGQADLPEPLASWFARVLPLVTGVSDLLTLDPGAGMRDLSRRMRDDLTPSAVYEPLEEVFVAALGVLGSVPAGDLVAAATQLRDGVVTSLDELEPRLLVTRLRAAHRRLVDAAPAAALQPLDRLHALKAAFHARVDVAATTPDGQVARVDARFDAVLGLLDEDLPTSVVHRLTHEQETVLAALRQAVDTLAESAALQPAQQSFEGLRGSVERLVPPELPREGTIGVDQVAAAFEHWRPTRRAAELDTRLTSFVDALAPAGQALDEALEAFTADLRAAAGLLDPLTLDPAVAEIFDAVRARVDDLEPGELLAQLKSDVYQPIAQAVEALDPAALAARLDRAYEAARTAVMSELTGLVDGVTRELGEHLVAVREAVDALLGQLDAALTGATRDLEDVVQGVTDLAFVGIVQRLRQVLDNLGTSFDTELHRIKQAFDAMLDAAPLGQPVRSGANGGSS